VRECGLALDLLKDEGSAVVFALGFRNVRSDMQMVQRRLERADVAVTTQTIEQAIVEQLKEMIEALKKAQQDLKSPPPPPSDGGPPPPKSLLNELAELKLMRSMQLQVNKRTLLYHDQDKSEQANDANVAQELRELGKRQLDIAESARALANKRNQ